MISYLELILIVIRQTMLLMLGYLQVGFNHINIGVTFDLVLADVLISRNHDKHHIIFKFGPTKRGKIINLGVILNPVQIHLMKFLLVQK